MGKNKKLLTIDTNHFLKVYDVSEDVQLEEKSNCVEAGNIYFPFKFFAGIQLCDENQYKTFKEGLA